MREIAGRAETEFGKELYETRNYLAGKNQYDGLFEKWYTTMGWKKRTVYDLINRYKELVRLSHDQKLIFEDLPITLSYAISAKSSESTPAKAQAKQAVLDGEIKTHKEYKDLIRKLDEKDNKLKELEENNIKLQKEKETLGQLLTEERV